MNKVPLIAWFDKSTVKHLRFSFSFFLLPVFLFALSQAETVSWINAGIAFVILHGLIFPSSNGYNSYQDRDETSIGGLKHPPKVSENLFYASLLFDITGVFLALLISVWFSGFVLLFIIMSRLYSWRAVRLKQFPVTGFLTVFIFQGAFVYLMTASAVAPFSFSGFFVTANVTGMAVSSLFIGSMYPLTQIYQHDADRQDGVVSISYKLGYEGTFVFSAVLFAMAAFLLIFHLAQKNQTFALFLFIVFIFPVAVRLFRWYASVQKDNSNANFENTMKANLIASTSMNMYFMLLVINNQLAIF
jgi:1,4-dihydroxy-2-naphthoate octaprenyltransferase